MKLTGNGGFTCHHCGTELVTTNHQWFIECDRCGSDDITNLTSFEAGNRDVWEANQRAHWEAEEYERAWEEGATTAYYYAPDGYPETNPYRR